jgi:carbon-monoxide dehydrogenase medium subunit
VYAFKYQRAESVGAASAALSADDAAKVLSGGMTLLPSMKHRLAAPTALIDVARLPEMSGVRQEADHWWVGAATRHQDVAAHAGLQQAMPGLATLAGLIGDPQVRARGTLGGSLANNDPSADYPAAALALQAQIITDRRTIEAGDFFQGMFATALHNDEIITGVRFRTPTRCAYAKFKHPASGYAMAGVFVAQYPAASGAQGAWRVAVTGVAHGVFRWSEAEQALAQNTTVPPLLHDDVIDDVHAPAAYRAHLAGVMLAQARQAWAKA